MSIVPPVPWENVVTKDYLDLRLQSLRDDIVATFRGEFVTQTRTIVLSLITTFIAFAGVVFAALRLG